MSHKTRATLALAMTAFFFVPSAVSESPFTATATNNDCWVAGYHHQVRSLAPCSVTLDMTLTGHGCEGDWCAYTLNVTTTGHSPVPGWLGVDTFFFTGAGGYVIACGPYPTQDLAGGLDLLPCENMVCNYGTFGTEVACSGSVEVWHNAPRGGCYVLFVTAHFYRNFNVDATAAGLNPAVCHREDGSLDFEP